MPSTHLRYDHANMRQGGATTTQIKALQKRLARADAALERLRATDRQGFFELPYRDVEAGAIERLAGRLAGAHAHLVVIGIGGSDLGARAVIRALGTRGKGMEISFLGNPDPDTIAEALEAIPWKRTLVNVVSKSGRTLETMSVFMAVRARLIKAVGKERFASRVIATTDPSDGVLYRLAKEEGYEILPHPLNVGGRFSVLSVVGLFPSACAGVSVRRLLKGARSIEDERRAKKGRCQAARHAAEHYLALTRHGKGMHVLMPYADRLDALAQWYRQLWAESLGKTKAGKPVGPTPIAALGAIDQHSQIQLYMEGPADKALTFIEIKKFAGNGKVPRVWTDIEGIDYLGGNRFVDIIHAERKGTASALAKAGRPNGTIFLPKLDPEPLGALLMFYELSTAYMAQLMSINAYDQPGVEAGKQLARTALTRM